MAIPTIMITLTLPFILSSQGTSTSVLEKRKTPMDIRIVARFLVSVDEPWNNCRATVVSPQVIMGTDYQHCPTVKVDMCDEGKLMFKMEMNPNKRDTYLVTVTFYTSVIHAMPPSCQFGWNGSYIEPSPDVYDTSPLLGCLTEDSQQGYHPTTYMFHILDWMWL